MAPPPAGPAAEQIDVAYAAALARLRLTPEEQRLFQGQLAQIVAYANELQQVDVSGVEPMAHAASLENVWRTDDLRPGLERQAVLDNAPVHDGTQFRVPRIV